MTKTKTEYRQVLYGIIVGLGKEPEGTIDLLGSETLEASFQIVFYGREDLAKWLGEFDLALKNSFLVTKQLCWINFNHQGGLLRVNFVLEITGLNNLNKETLDKFLSLAYPIVTEGTNLGELP